MRHAVLLVATLALTGCDKSETPTTPPAPVAAAEPEPAAETPTDPCRDWSDLDVDALPPLPESPYAATLDHAWRTIHAKHYDPTLACKNWPALRLEYGKKLVAAKNRSEAYSVMNAMLGELEQSHLGIIPPTANAGEPRMGAAQGPAAVPVTVRYVGGEVIIVDAAAHGLRSGLPAGAALVEVEGRPVTDAIAYAKERFHRDPEAAFYIARTVSANLTCPAGTKKKVAFKPAGADAPRTKTVPCRVPELETLSMGNIKNVPVWVEHRMLKKKVGYVRFNIWLLPLLTKIEAAIKDMRKKGMQALIIDLRGNPGGVGMMVVPVARMLLSESGSLGTMQLREGSQEFKVIAGEDPFAGKLAILVDEGSVSTSEIFAHAMQEIGRAKIFGASPTPGAALPSLIEELPGGALLQYVVADYRSPAGTTVEGKGVSPDVAVPEAAADFASGRDPVLDAAHKALQTAAHG
jgi:carboxyl-terminal processing protease